MRENITARDPLRANEPTAIGGVATPRGRPYNPLALIDISQRAFSPTKSSRSSRPALAAVSSALPRKGQKPQVRTILSDACHGLASKVTDWFTVAFGEAKTVLCSMLCKRSHPTTPDFGG